jgi:hypothetical protein
MLFNLVPKMEREGKHSGLFCEASIALTPKLDKGITIKQNHRSFSLMSIQTKIFNKILAC